LFIGIPHGHIIIIEGEILTSEGMGVVNEGPVLPGRILRDIAKRVNILLK